MTPTSDGLRLSWANEHLELVVDGDLRSAELSLLAMRTPSTMASLKGEERQFAIALEGLGWVRDAESSDGECTVEDLALVKSRAEAWLCGQGDEARTRLALQRAFDRDVPLTGSQPSSGVYEETLAVMLRALTWGAPHAKHILTEIAGNRCADRVHADLLAITDLAVVERVVWTALSLAACADGCDQHKWATEAIDSVERLSGLEVLHAAERALASVMIEHDPLLLQTISEGRVTDRAAAGIYLHQFFMTTRYLVSIAAWIRPSMGGRLSSEILGYLREEIGHEEHERNACRTLGLSEAEIVGFAPLPLFAAYPWVLDAIAREDPLAFCLCITLAEGLPDTKKPLLGVLRKQGVSHDALGAHQEIDEGRDHTRIAREIAARFPQIDGARATRAISNFMLAAQVSQTAWNEVARYAVDTANPRVPVPFGLSQEGLASLRS